MAEETTNPKPLPSESKPESVVEEPKPIQEPKVETPEPITDTSVKNVGLDIGTMNLVAATLDDDDSVESCTLRNVFLEIDSFNTSSMDLNNISHIEIDNSIYILSQDAYNFANIFNKKVSRPMTKGVISANEIDSIDIMATMIKKLIGVSNNKNSICCYSIPANPLDSETNVSYHKNVFERIINQLNYKPISLNEATAIVYSECEDNDFTGIGISFGAGMTNVAVVFKAVPVLTFSLSRGGDWIDTNAGNSIGVVPNRVNLIKEKDNFELVNYKIGNKKEQRIREALIYYYNDLINYVVSNIINNLSKIEVEFPEEIPVIVSGGTSKPTGFSEIVSKMFDNYEFPFDIKEIRPAGNPMTAVAEGCLIKSFRS